eukprot:11083161-Ditylum_brightwellii.AAC.1
MASNAPSAHQGGIALCWKVNKAYEVKEVKFLGPHVLSFQLRMGLDQYFVMGCYIPPDDLAALEHVKKVWEEWLKGCKPLLLGDLNIDLEYPRDKRDGIIAKQCNSMDLHCMSRQFHGHHRNIHMRGQWSWRQKRMGRWISSKPDYFLAQEKDRRKFW